MVGAACLLIGCLFNDDKGFPDIPKDRVVGCWSQIKPTTASCREECFDPSAAYYSKVVDKDDTSLIVERSGSFDVKGKTIGTSYKIAGTRSPSSVDSGGNRVGYAFQGETLVMLSDDGRSLTDVKFVRSDSTRNCGARWRIFTKPGGWSLP